MERKTNWIGAEYELNSKQLLYFLEGTRYYSIDFCNGNIFWGHVDDIKRTKSKHSLYLVKADANLELFDGDKVKIRVADKGDYYEFRGKNFSGKLYE